MLTALKPDFAHRLVVGARTRYSMNGGAHKVEALIMIAPYRMHVTKTDFYREEESRAEPWQVYVTVYVGLDFEAARAADDRVNKLFEQGGTLTE